MSREGVFISYRRSDAPSATGRLCDHLRVNGFGGPDDLFVDIDNIPPGADFRSVIRETLGKCDIVLVVIGRSWLDAADPSGRRRLDSPSDTHRLEIAAALQSEAIVVPVLVEGAQHPSADQLPPDLEELAYRNSWALTERRFGDDVADLAGHLETSRREARTARALRQPPAVGRPPTQEPLTSAPGLLSEDSQPTVASSASPVNTTAKPRRAPKPPLSATKRRVFTYWLPGVAVALVVFGMPASLLDENSESSVTDAILGSVVILALGLWSLIYALRRRR